MATSNATDRAKETGGISRRQWIGASATAVGSVTGPLPMRAQSANDKAGLGLIGAGGRGTALAQNLAVVENVEFKTICEVNDKRGDALLQKLEQIRGKRPNRVIDMRQVLDDKDIDGVVIATPEHWHALAA